MSKLLFELISEDRSDYYPRIGRGHIRRIYEAEVPEGRVIRSEFQRIENEDNVVMHSESMVFIPAADGLEQSVAIWGTGK